MNQIGRVQPSAHATAPRAFALAAAALLALLLVSAIAYGLPLGRPLSPSQLSPIQFSPSDVQATPAPATSAPFAPGQTAAPGSGVLDPANQTPAIGIVPPTVPNTKPAPTELPDQSLVPTFQPGPKAPLKPSIPPQN